MIKSEVKNFKVRVFMAISLFVFIQITAFGQWEQLGFIGNMQMSQMDISGHYMFVSRFADSNIFVRVDLSDMSMVTMVNPYGKPFSISGYKQIESSGEHIFYTDHDSVYFSHNYGETWSKANFLSKKAMYILTTDEYLFLGAFRRIFMSQDFGNTFTILYEENYYTNTTLDPLLFHDSSLYFTEQRGLVKALVNGGSNETLHSEDSFFWSIISYGDTLIASSRHGDIFQSNNSGVTWTMINEKPFGSVNFFKFFKAGNDIYAAAGILGFYASFDKGLHFYPFNEGFPATGITDIRIYEDYIYISTVAGLYRRLKSEIIQPSGIEDHAPDPFQFTLFPNPAKSAFTVEAANCNISEVSVFSITGEKLISSFAQNEDVLKTDVSMLKSGVYIVKVFDGQHQYKIQKMVKY